MIAPEFGVPRSRSDAIACTSRKNIEALIEDGGDISIGGQVLRNEFVATAADDCDCLAMLVRRDCETLSALLKRLNKAIGTAWSDNEFADEING